MLCYISSYARLRAVRVRTTQYTRCLIVGVVLSSYARLREATRGKGSAMGIFCVMVYADVSVATIDLHRKATP